MKNKIIWTLIFITLILRLPVINQTQNSSNNSNNFLSPIKNHIVNFFHKSIPDPHASLLAGMVVGDKTMLSKSFYEKLKNTGTAHVIVASGMNVTIVASFVMGILVKVTNRKKAIIISGIFVWGYVLLVGFEAPIVRAGIMGTLTFLAQVTGKKSQSLRLLLITVLIMLIIFPSWIISISFWLSTGATFSIILFEPEFSRLLRFVPEIIRESLSSSLAAQVATAPLIFAVFGQFNIFSPLINAITLWVVAPITIIGMIAGFTSFISNFVAYALLLLSYPFSLWFVWVINIFS